MTPLAKLKEATDALHKANVEMEEASSEFAEVFFRARSARRMTLNKLSKELRMSETHIWRLQYGLTVWTYDLARKAMQILEEKK